jgi:uncharacterized protein (TIGR02246 family)
MKRHLAVGAVVLFAASFGYRAGTTRAASVKSDSQARPADRAAIEKLMWNYVRALDTENPDAYAATYTPDGQFGNGPKAVKGREALKKMIADYRKQAAEAAAKGQKRPPMYHMLMNSDLEFTGPNHAHMEAYWQTVFGSNGPSQPARIAAAGREVDELVRVNGQWFIQLRDVAPKN